ncbi:MAG: glycogen synthase [Polyangiaceae bacterium]|nr:glycogen synthase [Polyangiaceae bacterium]
MDILFVAAELAPITKASSVADAVFALSKTLKNLGHRVTIAMPRHPAIERAGVLAARRLTPLVLPAAPTGRPVAPGLDVPREITVFDGRLASGVELVLFDAKRADGTSVYDESADATEPRTAALQSAVLCRAAIELMRQRVLAEQAFDVVHAHDWPAAMVPYLMKVAPELAVTQSVFTIHDLRRQGAIEKADDAHAALAVFGLGDDHFTPSRLEFYGGLNMMKGGVIAADAVTTVSPTYALEISQPAGGARLDGVLRARREPPIGILHGVDYSVWNPATDPALAARYDADDPSNKARCKTTLLAELGLELDPARPLFVAIGGALHDRSAQDQGIDVLAAALPRLLKQDLSFIVARPAAARRSSDDAEIDAAVRRAPERARHLESSESLVHKLLAAADFTLSPARYEPCGTLQMRAGRYGALPLATRVGGYLDSVVDLDAALETGTGFLLDPPSPDSLTSGVGRAIAAFRHPRFGTVRRRIMRVDVSWDRPARRYVQLYRQLAQRTTSAPPEAIASASSTGGG